MTKPVRFFQLSSTNTKKPNQAKTIAISDTANPFSKYSENYQTALQKIIHWAAVLLIIFGLLGLAWSIPFPYLKFLGIYNGFFNWASFLIAAAVYYYYKKFPGLSFGVFFILFALSYGVMVIDSAHKTGGPALWLVSLAAFIIGAALQFSSLKIKGQKPSFNEWLKFILISPVWVLHFLFPKRKAQ
ncbi:MAG TPA: hypothetical protein VIM55_02695 [Mucilaginibacter sp.]